MADGMNQRAQAARQLLSHPMFEEIFAGLEQDAVNRAIMAPLTDDAARAAQLSEARVIRAMRQRLRVYAADVV
jgi:hypothetical protein